jgi:hypothetical protein
MVSKLLIQVYGLISIWEILPARVTRAWTGTGKRAVPNCRFYCRFAEFAVIVAKMAINCCFVLNFKA